MAAVLLRGSVWAALYLASFTVISSYAFLYFTNLLPSYPDPLDQWYQWWAYLPYWENSAVSGWLFDVGLPSAFAPLAVGVSVGLRRRLVRGWPLRRDYPPARAVPNPIRGGTDNHGHAKWATFAEMLRLWPSPDPVYGGVVVGEAYDPRIDKGPFSPAKTRTWGHGGKAPLLIDPCHEGSTHSLIVAGSGSYKSVSAVSSLLTWTGSAVVLDPAQELGPMLKEDRLRLGHRVFILDPDALPGDASGFNVLDWIDISSPIAETNISAVVEWICGYTSPTEGGNHKFFKDRGKSLVTCLLADLLWDPHLSPSLKTLRTLRQMISVPKEQLVRALESIHQHSHSRLARDLAGPLFETPEETFGGIHTNADEDTKWLSIKAYADLVAGDSFRAADITLGKTDVFVSLPLKSLQATPAVARCIVGALLNAVYEADGNVNGRVLFLLDEAARLGRMGSIEIARDAGRKYGITLHLLYQSIGQLEQQWGREGKRAWYESVSWRAFAAVNDYDTAEELSKTIGSYGVLTWSESRKQGWFSRRAGGGGKSVTYTEHSRRLIRPEEIMHDLREDAQIIIPKNGRPAICGRAIYFRRPEFTKRVTSNRFFRGSPTPSNLSAHRSLP